MSAREPPQVFPREQLRSSAHGQWLVHHRPGDTCQPLIVLAPGGGHLARIFYGDPEANEADFLLHWLNGAKFECIAISYPSDHPTSEACVSEMSVRDWAQGLAEVIAPYNRSRRRRLVLVGWSMAGRLACAFAKACAAQSFHLHCFVGLAATPPMLNLTHPRANNEPTTRMGLWDATSRAAQWEVELSAQGQRSGGEIIARDRYRTLYRCNTPLRLRAEPREDLKWSLANVIDDLATFEYEHYPLCAVVAPNGIADARHALTDRATWSFINTQRTYAHLYHRLDQTFAFVTDAGWHATRALMESLASRLYREMPGGHFFFLGERSARATAEHIVALIAECARVEQLCEELVVRT